MNRTAWIIIGLLVVLGLGGLIYMTKKDTVNVDTVNPTSIIASTDRVIGDHTYGNKDAKVVLFEYTDFQCSGCGGAYRNTPTIQKLYKDKVLFVFRNYPQPSMHPNALAAASAAEAAGLQGKYQEMSDLLFEKQSELFNLTAEQRGDAIVSYAQQLGLDINKFNTDMASQKVQDKIQTDIAIGNKAGVNRTTPSYFIGTEKIGTEAVNDVIQQKGDKLMDLLDEALKNAGETPPARS